MKYYLFMPLSAARERKTFISRNKFFLLFISIIFSIHHIYAQNVWTQIADYPGDARSACIAFNFGGTAAVGLGYDGSQFRRSFYTYYPSLNAWTSISSMGGASGDGLQRNVAAGFTIGSKSYAGTGQGGASYLGDFWQYDVLTDVWTQKANFGGSARRSAVGFSVGQYGYIALGQDANGFDKDIWQYDTLANSWSQKTDFPGTARRLAIAFAIGNKAYVGTGDDGTFTNDFYEYDPSLETWTQKADFAGSPRYGATAFAVNNRGYLGLGYDTALANTSDFWQYNPDLDSWTQYTDFPSARANAVSFSIGTAGYVGTGYDTTQHNDFWMNDVATEISESSNPVTSSQIFPDPVFDDAVITMSGKFTAAIPAFQVFDLSGKEVTGKIRSESFTEGKQKISIRFNRGKLYPGIYHYSVKGKGVIASGKFLVLD